MNRFRHVRRAWVALLAFAASFLIAGTGTSAQGPGQGFPKEKAELLGGASYAALFGQLDDGGSSSSASSPSSFNPRRPPNVSPNVVANAPQVIPPTGRIGRSETTVAVGGEGKFVVVGWNDAEGFLRAPFGPSPATPGLSGFGFSTDGGQTFTDGDVPFVPGVVDPANPTCGGLVTRGDPWLDIGGVGKDTVYYANLAVHEKRSCLLAFAGIPAGVAVHRGKFAAKSFAFTDVRLLQSPEFPNDFYDKEALATDKSGSRPHVYVSLTNFEGIPISPDCSVAGGFGTIEVWRSLDGGDTWAGPVVVQPDQTNTSDLTCFTGRLNQGSAPAVGPDGTVYVAYQNGPDFLAGVSVTPLDVDIKVARSDDFGATFGAPVKVGDINSIRNSPPDGYNRTRINDFPRIAVADSGPFRGRVYVAFQSAPAPGAHASNVFVSHSDDRGQTWSTPVRIGAAVATNTLRFWPVVTVQTGGNVDVVYYESVETNVTPDPNDRECRPPGRAVPGQKLSSLVDVFWAQSIDGGVTFETPMLVTDVTSNWCKARVNIIPNFGDYIDSRSFGNRVFTSWADGRLPITPDTLPAPAGPRDRTADAFYATVNTIGRAPR